ncbi:hypothetical protein [Pseudorhodoferax aquiterrae]|nr:hypothetical protein [Pseudorhodoferax aquiterrae]
MTQIDHKDKPQRQRPCRKALRPAGLGVVLLSVSLGLATKTAQSGESAEATGTALEVCNRPHDLKLPQLKRVEDAELVRSATGAIGQGNLCGAVAYEVRQRLTVYRLSNAPVVHRDRWWTLTDPSGTAEQYRKDNVMCDAWFTQKKTTCQLEVGTHVAVGFGQSHSCEGFGDRPFAASSKWQVYLVPDKDGKFDTQAVDCKVGDGLE